MSAAAAGPITRVAIWITNDGLEGCKGKNLYFVPRNQVTKAGRAKANAMPITPLIEESFDGCACESRKQ
jgi:hypothetical protein